jgi:(R,R)-butanediol dehydrogenase/meso-butanediol dehydrogenase/diacetyl reductase
VRALRFHGPGDLRVDEVGEPVLRPGAVKVAVSWCGICGTDVHEYREGPHAVPAPGRPHPLTGEQTPLTLGHELVGVVVESAAAEVPPGTAVAVEPLLACGRCPECLAGTRHLCRIGGALGISGAGGGFAERVVVDVDRVHPLPDDLPLDIAALVEPLAVGWHAVRRGGVGRHDAVLVVGAGPIGLACLIAARAAGAAHTVVAVRSTGLRADLAAALGADVVVTDLDEARSAAPAVGYDVVLETAANDPALRVALGTVRRGGTVVDVGLWKKPVELNLNRLLAREISLVGSMAYEPHDFPEVLAALAADELGDVSGLITGKVSLEHAVRDGFDALVHRRSEHVKVLVQP